MQSSSGNIVSFLHISIVNNILISHIIVAVVALVYESKQIGSVDVRLLIRVMRVNKYGCLSVWLSASGLNSVESELLNHTSVII